MNDQGAASRSLGALLRVRVHAMTDSPFLPDNAPPAYLYGWGRTKHLRNGMMGSFCGAAGGGREARNKPLCKTCARMAGLKERYYVPYPICNSCTEAYVARVSHSLSGAGSRLVWYPGCKCKEKGDPIVAMTEDGEPIMIEATLLGIVMKLG